MNRVLRIIGMVLVMLGVHWLLQVTNILPDSFMAGQTKWAIYGGISLAVGLALLGWVKGEKQSPNKS